MTGVPNTWGSRGWWHSKYRGVQPRQPAKDRGGRAMVHIYDSISRSPRATTVLIEQFVRPMCSCGWVGWFESLSHDEAKRDWDKHIKVRAR